METTIINIIIPPAEPVLVVATAPTLEPVTVNSEEIVSPVSVAVETPADTPVLVNVSSVGEQGPPGPPAEVVYSKTFGSVTNDTILPAEHGLSIVRGVTVLAPNRSEVEVYVEQGADHSVFIDSNSNLNNYILKMY